MSSGDKQTMAREFYVRELNDFYDFLESEGLLRYAYLLEMETTNSAWHDTFFIRISFGFWEDNKSFNSKYSDETITDYITRTIRRVKLYIKSKFKTIEPFLE